MLRLTILCICLTSSLVASLVPFLKLPGEKPSYHKMDQIDFIYMINLDQRPEKYADTYARFEPYGIYPYRFSAVNGWELSQEVINQVGVKYKKGMKQDILGTTYQYSSDFEPHHEKIHRLGVTYFCHCMSRGAIGIVLSHVSVLYDAYQSGYKTIWVMEDDVEPISDPRELSTLIRKLDHIDPTWDVLFTDIDTKNSYGQLVPCNGYAIRINLEMKPVSFFQKKTKMSKDFTKFGMRYGAYSMIVRRSGMKKIIDYYNRYHIFLPYDMDFWFSPGLRIYRTNREIVSFVPGSPSDNGGPNYKQ